MPKVKHLLKPTKHQCHNAGKTLARAKSNRAKSAAGRSLAKCRWGK